MKIRKGFVSNSSSSSFICDVSGHLECGFDMSIEDAQMYECENEHTFCEDYLITDGWEEYSEDIVDGYYIRYEVPSKFCPICQMKNIKKSDMIKFLLKKSNTTISDIEKEIREKFDSYTNLIDYLKDE